MIRIKHNKMHHLDNKRSFKNHKSVNSFSEPTLNYKNSNISHFGARTTINKRGK